MTRKRLFTTVMMALVIPCSAAGLVAAVPSSSVSGGEPRYTYTYPLEMMQAIIRSLKPGGRVVLVEYRKEDPAVPIKPVHKMTVTQVIEEMKSVGLRHKQTIETLPRQHILIFECRPPETRPATQGSE